MVDNFSTFIFREEYEKYKKLGDTLSNISDSIDWERFRVIISPLYKDNKNDGGRPHLDEIVMIKTLVLQHLYGLSDYEIERNIYDRMSFRHFLGFPDTIPDRSTIWLFRERLINSNCLDLIWEELQHQIDKLGFGIHRGVIQDATFITTDPGHAKKDKPRGDEALTRRSKEGTWSKKGNNSYFGYKMHTLVDKEFMIIREVGTSTASLHDSQIDLTEPGQTVYRDKGYFGVKPNASMDKTMHRATRDHPLSCKEKRRNKAISRIRSLGELPYAVMKRIFKGGHVLVTTIERVHVKNIFSCFSYNLYRLKSVQKAM
ncbi:IS5 family transposase [Methanospirillum purgamenti]|uniref:IS5 family transposase n=1 Tax=Methanospirillum hungatei TaxID=2203 RepID=A0A8F5ZHC1_METHU|nr:IS5 family transposase [Methanospirillum hungatei]QXO94258.1 IS5 family transposase [Methanospirillum hungatei]